MMNQNQKWKTEQSDTKGNAKTALIELATLAGLTKSEAPAPAASEAETSFKKPQPAAPAAVKADQSLEVSVIAAGVVVEGTIRTEGALDIRGVVKGDLIAKGAITASGEQTGNITGSQVIFSNATIEGNVVAKGHIEIDRGSKITGDVHGGSVQLDGHATGLICAEGLVCLRKNAILHGDIQAGAISIEEGAQVSGQIKMNAKGAAGTVA